MAITQVNKISYDRKKGIVKVVYEEKQGDNDTKEITFTAYDRPLPSFEQSMDALIQDAVKICKLPEEYSVDMFVRSVSLSNTGGIMGAVITCLKDLDGTSNAPLVINSPHLPECSYSESETYTLPDGCKARILTLLDEAEKYINGDRAEKQEKLKLVS